MPNKRLPVYKLVIDDSVEGMDFMGLVDYPAHGKQWVTLSKLPKKVELRYEFNEEKRIVSGVAIATDLQIYRRDDSGFEYNIIFTKKDVLDIIKMFSKKGMFNNVNFMHDMDKVAKGIYLIESTIVRDDKSNIPTEFKNQNLQPGSLIFSYWAESDEAWKFIKENAKGFSIEGWFKEVEVKFHKNKKQMSLLEKLGFKKAAQKIVFDKTKKDKYAEATTADGVVVMWEGELAEGTALFVVPTDGTDPILASAGEYPIDVEGVIMVVTVNEDGTIASVVEGEAMNDDEPAEVEEALKAVIADYKAALAAQKKAFDTQLETIGKEVDELREALEKVAEKTPPKKVTQTGTKPSWKDMKKSK